MTPLQRFQASLSNVLAAARRQLRAPKPSEPVLDASPNLVDTAAFYQAPPEAIALPVMCKRCGLEQLSEAARLFGLCRTCRTPATPKKRDARRRYKF